MATPQPQCTKKEQRAMIRFLCSERVPWAEIHRRLLSQYEDSTLQLTSVYKWIEKFLSGRTSVMCKEGAGRPSISTVDGRPAPSLCITIVRPLLNFYIHLYTLECCKVLSSYHDKSLRWISAPDTLSDQRNRIIALCPSLVHCGCGVAKFTLQ